MIVHRILRRNGTRLLVVTLAVFLCAQFATEAVTTGQSSSRPEGARRPKVLIIGDSISIGYTPHVVQLLGDSAVVKHNPGNAQHTGTGLKKLDRWLGDEQWDVIHFNWGLWDLCYRHPEAKTQGKRDKVNGTLTTGLEQYERNLDRLVTRLKKTGAVLVWANTTVVPDGEAGRKVGDDLKYNSTADRVMKRHEVRTNDLNRLTRSFGPELFTAPGNVHFTPEGSRKLAGQVTVAIRSALSADTTGATDRPISRILFGSCVKQENPAPILGTIVDARPDLFVFLGDNIYGDTQDMAVLRQKYAQLGAKPMFARLRDTCPVLATWDDHDYGVNDGGADYSKRVESERVFLDFWNDALDSPRRSRPGVYDARVFGPEGQRVQVILLDTRYFRSPLKTGERRVGGSYYPDDDPEKTMLGAAQWKWLEQQLRKPAEVRIVASSIQCIPEAAGQETWSNLPRERQRLFDTIKRAGADGVMIISGDRHWSEISSVAQGLPYRLYDVTSSSLNQVHPRGTPTENRLRDVDITYHSENFGGIAIDWEADDPQVSMMIFDMDGEVQIAKMIRLSELRGG